MCSRWGLEKKGGVGDGPVTLNKLKPGGPPAGGELAGGDRDGGGGGGGHGGGGPGQSVPHAGAPGKRGQPPGLLRHQGEGECGLVARMRTT